MTWLQNIGDRFWKVIVRWRWAIAALTGAIAILVVWTRYRPENFDQIQVGLLVDVLPYALLLPLAIVVTLSWIRTRSELNATLKQQDLKRELRQKLARARGWDEFADFLLDFLSLHAPLTGLSLSVYDPASEQDARVAERTISQAEGVHWLDMMLALDSQRVGQLKVQLGAENLFLPKHFEFLKGILPEVSHAVERTNLLLSGTERITALQQAEKAQIARYLHDILGDNLAYLRMKLEQLAEQGEFVGNPKIRTELNRIRDVADQAYENVRGLLHELRVGISSDFGASLQECIALIQSRARFQIDYQSEGEPRQLPDEVQRQILYIVREILRNVEKHARAREVSLKLIWSETGLTIESANDGPGFDVVAAQKKNGHYGLKIVQEITNELNGQLKIRSSTGDGAQVTLWIPY